MKEKFKQTIRELGIAMSASVFTIVWLFTILYLATPLIFDNTILGSGYQQYVSEYEEDTLIINLTNQCNNFTQDINKIHCVNEYFRENFVYVERKDKRVRSPQKTFQEGGVCRDAAVIYCTIFNKMGLECKFLFRHKKHVISAVWINDTFYDLCLLDQRDMTCQ